jgi:hypothetical protein
MNKTLSTILIVITILALGGGVFFAGTMYARANAYGPAMMSGWGGNNLYDMMGGGMMNGRGGYGMMSGGGNMMNGYGYNTTTLTPLTIDQAKAAAGKYIQSLDVQGLEVGKVMIFDNSAYVAVKESETGLGAFELLVDPASQTAYPEFGPNMMWNVKYGGLNHNGMMSGSGMMGGMMGGGMMNGSGTMGGMMGGGMMSGWNYQTAPSADVSAELTVTPEQAVEYAQKYLDAYYAGAAAAKDAVQFYGYYTLDFSKDGKIAGMLSVNGYNGQVFVHTWHGAFIEEAE